MVRTRESEAPGGTVWTPPSIDDDVGTAAVVEVFHEALLPALEPPDGLRCEARYTPGERRLLLGGDFVDLVETPTRETAFVIGDVAGHGPVAAAVALAMRASWRTLALGSNDVALWLDRMDQVLLSLPRSDELFVTVCVGVIDADRMSAVLTCAGHPPPILLTDVAKPIEMEPSIPLGVGGSAGQVHAVADVALGPRWALLAYTDGLIEGRRAPNSRERYGAESLAAWLSTHDPAAIDAAELDRLIADVESANGGRVDDDIAVLLLASGPP